MSGPVLELVSVTAGYGDNPIVRDFSTRLAGGTITTLIGGNGAGKSTLLRAIYGTNRLFSGQVVFKDESIGRLPPWERLKRGIGFVPQGRCNFPAMSVAENIKMACYTLAGEFAHQLVDLRLRSHIDAARRFIEQHQPGRDRKSVV